MSDRSEQRTTRQGRGRHPVAYSRTAVAVLAILAAGVPLCPTVHAQGQGQQAEQFRNAQQLAERYRYLADLRLAPQLWEANRLDRLRDILDNHRPGKPGAEDLRGFE